MMEEVEPTIHPPQCQCYITGSDDMVRFHALTNEMIVTEGGRHIIITRLLGYDVGQN